MSYFDDMYYESLEDDLYEEGANLDIRSILADNKKLIRSNLAQAKKAINSGDYDVAKKALKDAKTAIDGAKGEIDKIDVTWGSTAASIAVEFASSTVAAFIGLLIAFGIEINKEGKIVKKAVGRAKNTATFDKMALKSSGKSNFKEKLSNAKQFSKVNASMIKNDLKNDARDIRQAGKNVINNTNVKKTAITVSAAIAAAMLIENAIKVIKSVSKKEKITAETFNAYKLTANAALTKYSKACDQLQKACDQKQAAEKKATSKFNSIFKKESVDEVADIIEEAYMEDIIDSDEMDTLLEATYSGCEDEVIEYIESALDVEDEEIEL